MSDLDSKDCANDALGFNTRSDWVISVYPIFFWSERNIVSPSNRPLKSVRTHMGLSYR